MFVNRICLVAILCAILVLKVAVAADPPCYSPDGANRNAYFNRSDGEYYQPCNPAAKHSMCCGTGPLRVAWFNNSDECLPKGICRGKDAVLWRLSCTDPTWQDPACLKLFLNGTGYPGYDQLFDADGYEIADVKVTACYDGSFCYGSGNNGCCSQGQGVFIDYATGEQMTGQPNNSASGDASRTATSTLPSTSIATAGDNHGLSTAAKVGTGVGVGLPVMIVIAIVLLWYRRRKRDRLLDIGSSDEQGHSRRTMERLDKNHHDNNLIDILDQPIELPVAFAQPSWGPTDRRKLANELA